MPLTVSNFLLGPLIAFAVIGLLAGIFRLIFTRQSASTVPMYEMGLVPQAGDEYGLLCAAAVTEDSSTAESVRAMLTAAGIRATVATGRDGRIRVLVFEDELHRARRVMG
jgi:hypothetical protein